MARPVCDLRDFDCLALLVAEQESEPLAEALDRERPELVACWLLDTELRRAAQRIERLAQSMVTELLDAVSLYEVPPSLFWEARLLPAPCSAWRCGPLPDRSRK